MNPKRILVALTLAFVVSGLSTWAVSRKLTPDRTRKTSVTMYAAPARTIEAGEVLQPENVGVVAWPADIPLEEAFAKSGDVMGREALFPLAKGEPILSRDLSAPGSGVGLASKVPDGMRAVALRSDLVVGVAGFLVPGSHVDVLATYHSDRSAEPLTGTVLQNVVVLALGHEIRPDPAGKASDVAIVTLLLTSDESQRAVLASTQGVIHFVLRNGRDNGQSMSTPIPLSQLGSDGPIIKRSFVRTASIGTTAAPRRHEIETVLGGDVTPSGSRDGGVRP